MKKALFFSLISLSLFFGPVKNFTAWDDWHTRWAYCYLLCACWIAAIAYRKFGAIVAGCSWMLCASSIYVFAWRMNHFNYLEIGERVLLNSVAQIHLLTFLMLFVPFLFCTRRSLDILEDIFSWLCVLSSALIIIISVFGLTRFTHGTALGGLFNNESMAGCFIGATYPLVIRWRSRLFCMWQILPWVALFFLGQTMPFAVIGCASLMYLYSRKRYIGLKQFKWGVTIAVAGIGYAFLTFGSGIFDYSRDPIKLLMQAVGHYMNYFHGAGTAEEFFSGNGRYELWSMALKWWSEYFHWLFGSGAGTAYILVPRAQIEVGHHTQSFFIWMHNDYLQVLFEYGVLGLSLLLALTLGGLWRLRKTPHLLSVGVGYGVMALGNYPSRLAVHALLGMWLVARAFYKDYGKEADLGELHRKGWSE